jgi:hypothetical protein
MHYKPGKERHMLPALFENTRLADLPPWQTAFMFCAATLLVLTQEPGLSLILRLFRIVKDDPNHSGTPFQSFQTFLQSGGQSIRELFNVSIRDNLVFLFDPSFISNRPTIIMAVFIALIPVGIIMVMLM